MNNLKQANRRRTMMAPWKTCLSIIVMLIAITQGDSISVAEEATTSTRRINVPYSNPASSTMPYLIKAIFWFGNVDATSNYADVRLRYDDEQLQVTVHIIDRLLWYDKSPAISDLTKWDAASLYIDLNGNIGAAPDSNSHWFVGQLNSGENRGAWQAGFRGNGTGWVEDEEYFTTTSVWRGNAPNDIIDDRGWFVNFYIPFASLGLSKAPSSNSTWGLAVVVHDRDDASGSAIPDKVWPELMDPNSPVTWGQMVFGLPSHNPPAAIAEGETTIRQGLNGISVVDAHVGGHSTCGQDYWPDFFDGWGDANYAGYNQINIQNQWDIADWPCFSKYYVTFPLEALPHEKTIISAKLTMHLFGNAGGGQWGEPPDSYIQVLTVGEDWDETTLTWNNAPLALENISGTWVKPIQETGWPGWPGIPYDWDVSRAVAEAYANSEPLRLALYSADGDRHSGKYFTSSDTGDWNEVGRPTLTIVWGESCDLPDIECFFTYLPFTLK